MAGTDQWHSSLQAGAESGVSSPHAGAVRAVLRVLPLLFLPMTVHFPAVSQSGASATRRGGAKGKKGRGLGSVGGGSANRGPAWPEGAGLRGRGERVGFCRGGVSQLEARTTGRGGAKGKRGGMWVLYGGVVWGRGLRERGRGLVQGGGASGLEEFGEGAGCKRKGRGL